MNRRCVYTVFLLAGTFLAAPLRGADRVQTADLLVYGGTASGVMTAYSAAQEGLQVVLLEPGAHLGGMVTGGLSATDTGRFTVIGGYARDFYRKAAAHYRVHGLDRREDWFSEPHVSEAIFREMLRASGVRVYYHTRLRTPGGVALENRTIVEITTSDGQQWRAKIYADCTYEGDLMAQSNVSYTWGRESSDEYGEDLAGVRSRTPQHQFAWPLPAYDEHHHLFPEIIAGPLAPGGSGDKKVQAYNFRLILTDDPRNRLPIPRPEGYDRSRFVLLEHYLDEFQRHFHRLPTIDDLFYPTAIPHHKADFNNNGPISTDYIGHSWNYPEASYTDRDVIWRDHLLYAQSFIYFLSHDSSVPANLRAELNRWGLPKDEFADTGHWPNQLYVREGRRMVGEYVLRQSDLQTERTKPDSIGMGSYNSDSHNVERVAMPDGSVRNEGDVEIPVEPYEIPYRAITPKRSEVQNLLVPVCLSATHVAFASIRMEPQFMIIGQAAGVAVALAIDEHVPVQEISIPDLQRKLHEHGAILHASEEYPSRASTPSKP